LREDDREMNFLHLVTSYMKSSFGQFARIYGDTRSSRNSRDHN